MIDKAGEPMIVARASYLSDDITGAQRFLDLSLPALHEALIPLSRFAGRLTPIPLIIGLSAQRPGLPMNLATEIASRFKNMVNDTCRISSVETISCGHSAGLMAIEAGWRAIRDGSVEFCLAGGIDSYLEPETLEWLDKEEQLHSVVNKWGFAPGEAAGFCLLTSQRAAARQQLPMLGQVLAVATAREVNLIKTDSVCIGEGLTKALKQVLQMLNHSHEKVDHVICDMNGERYRADEYGFTVARLSEYFVDAADFLAPADCWGDIGAASGQLFINLAIAAKLRKYAKGKVTLVWTSSESGERSAAVLQ